MSLNGIDISNWQAGIDLSVVPYDFVIAKATEGTNYVSGDCARQVEQVRSRGKLFGTYHYINGVGANAEAEYYIRNIENWVGEGILALDWESYGNAAWGNESYLDQVTARVIELTGIPPLLYGSQSVYTQLSNVAKRHNCGLWIAQYANNVATGYQDTPWNEGSYDCAIRQYSSAGRLNGWSANLDLDKFYGDEAAWKAYANPSNKATVATPSVPETSAPSYDMLQIDGSCGPATIRRWQQVMGTTVDGVISGQLVPDQKTYWRPNLVDSCVTYGGTGSEVIRATQRKLKSEGRYSGAIDGLLGPNTIKGIQAHYGLTQDASFGPATVRALQTALNQNRF